jgi:hypothetical protein
MSKILTHLTVCFLLCTRAISSYVGYSSNSDCINYISQDGQNYSYHFANAMKSSFWDCARLLIEKSSLFGDYSFRHIYDMEHRVIMKELLDLKTGTLRLLSPKSVPCSFSSYRPSFTACNHNSSIRMG